MAKSSKRNQRGATDGKGSAKELARLEKRLQKARNVEAKRTKQAAEATAEVADLTGRIGALKGENTQKATPDAKPSATRGTGRSATKAAGVPPQQSTRRTASAPKPSTDGTPRRRSTATTRGRTAKTPTISRRTSSRRSPPGKTSGDGKTPS